MSNIVAIVGRPNVGKSTIFNRFTESRQAITDEISGVTRDRHYGKSEWNGREFSVIDTGGYVKGSDDIFEIEIRKQVELAIDEANVILFLVDAKSGITDLDQSVVNLLRKSNKKVVVGVNKVDNTRLLEEAVEFYNLGMGDYIPIASISGSGTGELLDELVKHFVEDTPEEDFGIPKFAVIGRPNVGKSSFINALIGKEQNIVTEIAGTTRDSLNTPYNKFGFDFILVDTAVYLLLLYILINILYSLYFKYLVILDILSVSSGFLIRLIAGGIVSEIDQSLWTLLIISFASLGLATGKRLGQFVENPIYLSANWNDTLLKYVLIFCIIITIIFYGLFSFDSEVIFRHGSDKIWLSFPVIILIFIRYLYIAWYGKYLGDPTDALLKDRYLQIMVLLWVILISIIFIV